MKFIAGERDEAVHTYQIQKESIVQALVMYTYENLHPNRESLGAIKSRLRKRICCTCRFSDSGALQPGEAMGNMGDEKKRKRKASNE